MFLKLCICVGESKRAIKVRLLFFVHEYLCALPVCMWVQRYVCIYLCTCPRVSVCVWVCSCKSAHKTAISVEVGPDYPHWGTNWHVTVFSATTPTSTSCLSSDHRQNPSSFLPSAVCVFVSGHLSSLIGHFRATTTTTVTATTRLLSAPCTVVVDGNSFSMCFVHTDFVVDESTCTFLQ